MNNPFQKLKVKLTFYMTDVLTLLLHGMEYWSMNNGIISKLSGFQRTSLLYILRRSHHDHITNEELYDRIHRIGCGIYPIILTMAERKLRYFGRVVREGLKKEDLTSRIYWSDVKRSWHRWDDVDYEHIKSIKAALKILHITEAEANAEVLNEKKWNTKLKDQKQGPAYEQWKNTQRSHREKRHRDRQLRTQVTTLSIS
jgi:hypothetical protein